MATTQPASAAAYGTYGTGSAGQGVAYTPVYEQVYDSYGAIVPPAPTGIFEPQFESQFE